MRRCAAILAIVPLFLSALVATACGRPIDVAQELRVEIVSSGWSDAGVVDGKNKIVPAIAVRLKNTSDQELPMLQLNAMFRRVGNEEEWGSGFVTAAGSAGLAPGGATGVLTVNSQLGYTGTDSAADLLNNSHFTDATVDLYARYGSSKWTRVGAYPVPRQLMMR
jgi:hypothetical protein